MRIIRLGLAAAAMALALGTAAAEDVQPSETTETFGNWTVRCRKPADAPKACELVHSVAGQGGVITQIAIGTPPGKEKPLVVVQTPLGVLVSRPVTIAAGSDTLTLPFVTCLQIGCLAQLETSNEALDALATGGAAKLGFAESSGRAIDVSIPLDGMKDALARLRAS